MNRFLLLALVSLAIVGLAYGKAVVRADPMGGRGSRWNPPHQTNYIPIAFRISAAPAKVS